MNTELTTAVQAATGLAPDAHGVWTIDTPDHGKVRITGLARGDEASIIIHFLDTGKPEDLQSLGANPDTGFWNIVRSAALPDVPAMAKELGRRLAKMGFVPPPVSPADALMDSLVNDPPSEKTGKPRWDEDRRERIHPMPRSGDCGPAWHRLNYGTSGDRVVHVMAATSDDGIGVIARWTLADGEWSVEAMDTEGGGWCPVNPLDEGEIVPLEPPAELLAMPGEPSEEAEAHAILDDPEVAILRNEAGGYPGDREPHVLALSERVSAVVKMVKDYKRWLSEAEAKVNYAEGHGLIIRTGTSTDCPEGYLAHIYREGSDLGRMFEEWSDSIGRPSAGLPFTPRERERLEALLKGEITKYGVWIANAKEAGPPSFLEQRETELQDLLSIQGKLKAGGGDARDFPALRKLVEEVRNCTFANGGQRVFGLTGGSPVCSEAELEAAEKELETGHAGAGLTERLTQALRDCKNNALHDDPATWVRIDEILTEAEAIYPDKA